MLLLLLLLLMFSAQFRMGAGHQALMEKKETKELVQNSYSGKFLPNQPRKKKKNRSR